jgi:endonuclease-3 related protein
MPEVEALYALLLDRLGPQGWWPAETAEEMIVGAVLTQAVAWHNACRAIMELRRAGLLRLDALAVCDASQLAPLVRSAGYFNVKARKLVALARHINAVGGVPALAALPAAEARAELLGVYGVGPETADAIVCYALGKPVMVADAYARRVLGRVGILPQAQQASYASARQWLMQALDGRGDAAWFGEFHALLVAVGKHWCRPTEPRCVECPALRICAQGCRAEWEKQGDGPDRHGAS